MPRHRTRLVLPVVVLAFLASALSACTPATIGSRYGGFSGGAHLPFLSDQDLARELDLMKAAGATWLRFDLDWSYVEPERGVYHWGLPDRVVAAARERRFKVALTITYTPRWAAPAAARTSTWPLPSHFPPTNPADFGAFARVAASHYAAMGVHHWSIWNEPNWADNYAPRADPAHYTRLLKSAYSNIKAVDPSAFVIAAGLSPAGTSPDRRILDPWAFLSGMYAAGAKGSMDAVAVHPYSFPLLPMENSRQNPFFLLPDLYEIMRSNGDGAKKIWFLEFGGPTRGTPSISEAQQGPYLQQAYRQLARWPWAGPLFWYSLRDTGTSTAWWENLGLYRRNWSAKPGAAVYRDTKALRPGA